MKRRFFSLLIASILFSGCGTNSSSSDDSNTIVNVDENISKFISSLSFTPYPITQVDLASKKIILNDGVVYLTSDGHFYAGGKGTYEVKNNVLILTDDELIYCAFKEFNSTGGLMQCGGHYTVPLTKVKIQSFDENNFNPYPTYTVDGNKVTLDIDDDYLVLNNSGYVQLTIRDDNYTGVRCTTKYERFSEFKNAFSNNELVLKGGSDINCSYFINDKAQNITEQNEEIKFIDNQGGSYQVRMSGYFSGDYNISELNDDLLLIEDDYEDMINFDNKISGEVHFYDSDGNEVEVPQNTYVRLVPTSLKNQDKYEGIVCKVDSNNKFGDKCVIAEEEYYDTIVNALDKNETFEFDVYQDKGKGYYFNKWDKYLGGKDSAREEDWKDFNVTL